ncbi:tetratricopeptide repeat-containing sulfotransferase family protein [Magnetospira thiophila]
MAQGNLSEAETLCRKILAVAPGHARSWHVLGFVAVSKGDPHRGLEHLNKSRDLGSDNPLLLMHLGIARATTGDLDGAVSALRDCVAAEPRLGLAQYNLGLSLNRMGQHAEAENALRTATKLDPNQADAWIELATARMAQTAPTEQVLELLEKALALDANHVAALNLKATLLGATGQDDAALELMEQALSKAPERPELLVNYGGMLLDRDAPGAVEAFRKALTLAPDFPGAGAQLAAALERLNRVPEARAQAEAVLQRQPQSFLARLTLARCDLRYNALDSAQTRLEALRSDTLNDADFVNASKTLATVLERQGDYAAAFASAAAANARLRTSKIAAEGPTVFERIQWRKDELATLGISEWSREGDNEAPIFLIGFPRSGTTLMEQILRSHPRFISEGENEWLQALQSSLGDTSLDALSAAQMADLRATYWGLARKRHGSALDGHRLIDKMPLNILHLSLVRRIFPGAKILVALRDPRDCLISGFMQNFRRSQSMDQFLSLETAARLYDAVMDLWLCARDRLGLDWHEYRYEDLVDHPREILGKILQFLGEPWDDSVLNHHRLIGTSTTVATPSLRDVSEQIYSRARSRWPNYAQHLDPALPLLEPYIKCFGYD